MQSPFGTAEEMNEKNIKIKNEIAELIKLLEEVEEKKQRFGEALKEL